jgi:hypothetical protein
MEWGSLPFTESDSDHTKLLLFRGLFMRSNLPGSILVALSILVGFLLVSRNHAIPADTKTEAKWEYQVLDSVEVGKIAAKDKEANVVMSTHFQTLGLNKLAEEGWELITVNSLAQLRYSYYYLKRSKK